HTGVPTGAVIPIATPRARVVRARRDRRRVTDGGRAPTAQNMGQLCRGTRTGRRSAPGMRGMPASASAYSDHDEDEELADGSETPGSLIPESRPTRSKLSFNE